MESFVLTADYITLGQFLKEIGEIGTGGQAKWYLQDEEVLVDSELETRRGRKLYQGMQVKLADGRIFQIVESK